MNPDAVRPELVSDIINDSLDYGAINVLTSGAILPEPRPLNELFTKYKAAGGRGVVVTQGAEDPLNDAKGRAQGMVDIDPDFVDLKFVDAGHCPMDEAPGAVAAAWIGAGLV